MKTHKLLTFMPHSEKVGFLHVFLQRGSLSARQTILKYRGNFLKCSSLNSEPQVKHQVP